MQSINCSQLFKDENIKKTHKFRIQQLVKNNDILYKENVESPIEKAFLAGSGFFIISLERDCDGTPFYTLSTSPFNSKREAEQYVIHTVIGINKLNKLEDIEKAILINSVLKTLIITGISEDLITSFI